MSTFVKRLLLLFLCCFTLQTVAQELLFSNLKSQIPAQECYNILQDRKGYIWFSTEAGLCRYANNRMMVFNHKNGLNEKSVYAVTEDASGKIWIATVKNRILFFDGTRFKEPAFSGELKKLCANEYQSSIPYSLVADGDYLYLSDQYFAAKINIRTNRVTKTNLCLNGANFLFEKIGNKPLIPILYEVKNNKEYIIRVKYSKKDVKVCLPRGTEGSIIAWRTTSCVAKGMDFFGVGSFLIRIDKGGQVSKYTLPSRILSLYVDNRNGLWVGTLKGGMIYYPDVYTMKVGHHSMDGYSISGILLDREQGVWCSTLEKGIFCSRNAAITGYHTIEGLNKKSSILKQEEGRIFVSSAGNALFEIDRNTILRHELQFKNTFETMTEFSDITKRDDEWLLCGRLGLPVLDKQFKFKNKHIWGQEGYYSFGYAFAHSTDGKLYHVKFEQLSEIKGQISHDIKNMRSTIFCLLTLDTNRVLIGGVKGLYEVNVKTRKTIRLKGIIGKVIKIIRDRAGKIWILTKDKGIFQLDKDKVKDLTTVLGLQELPLFFDMVEGKNGEIWVASANGLYRLRCCKKGWEKDHYTTLNGLPSNDVYKVAADSYHLYFSTFEGLFRFPLNASLSNTLGPPIHLNKLNINGQFADPETRRLNLYHNQNTLRFSFDVLTFKNEGVTSLIYELTYNDEPRIFRQVQGSDIFFDNLSPGTYRLKVYGVNSEGVKNRYPLRFSIEIAPPFWREWPFLFGVGLLLILLIFLVIRLSVRSINRREEAKTLANKLMAEYQMSALQAQMNPHFIFNAINTIQGYILRKDEQHAYDYLAKFSKLIRMVLNHSQEKSLLLHSDLEVLYLYVELEQMRFGHAFDYEVIVTEEVDPHDIFIPGMLIQPYIENAIWHGLMNLEDSRRGKISLHISIAGEFLHISIEDNGVGREKAASFGKKHNHPSVGMSLTEKRLITLNQMRGFENSSVSIVDLFDNKANACGTRVELNIPLNQDK